MRRFTVLGEPVGKARPRYTRTGHAYTPKKTRDYEEIVKKYYQAKYGNCEPYEGAVTITITAYMKIAKSTPKYKKKAMLEMLTPCLKKPDVDNIEKIIMDALNGLVYKDDKQVTAALTQKFYGEPPCVVVEIEGAENE